MKYVLIIAEIHLSFLFRGIELPRKCESSEIVLFVCVNKWIDEPDKRGNQENHSRKQISERIKVKFKIPPKRICYKKT